MENILVIPKDKKQSSLIKALLEEMKVKFVSEKSENQIFSPELDKLIKQARKEKENGELTAVNPQNIWESIS